MTNSEMLENKIIESGIKKVKIAHELGISLGWLRSKIKNEVPFNVREVSIICELLRLKKNERDRIFFA